MMESLCFDCTYFVPIGMNHNDLEEGQWDDCIGGECRRHSPVAVEPDEDDSRVDYAYWPIVLSGDWCGEHKFRTANSAVKSGHSTPDGRPQEGCQQVSTHVHK